MKSVIMAVLLLSICVALVAGVIMPLAKSINETGASAISSVNELNSVIKARP